jgi:SAM-dependent methyltransferase
VDSPASFAEASVRYREQLARGLRLTGYPAAHFAARRIARVRELAESRGVKVGAVLDFGSGLGDSFAHLLSAFPGARIVGYEPTPDLRRVAKQAAGDAGAEMLETDALEMAEEVDLVYCSGVFRRIARAERIAAVASLARAIKPGGLACIWENSPLNPGTRLVMSMIPSDRGAQVLGPQELEVLALSAGLTPIAREFHFVFPRWLRALESLEPQLRSVPLGGQYLVAGQRG